MREDGGLCHVRHPRRSPHFIGFNDPVLVQVRVDRQGIDNKGPHPRAAHEIGTQRVNVFDVTLGVPGALETGEDFPEQRVLHVLRLADALKVGGTHLLGNKGGKVLGAVANLGEDAGMRHAHKRVDSNGDHGVNGKQGDEPPASEKRLTSRRHAPFFVTGVLWLVIHGWTNSVNIPDHGSFQE